MERGKRNLWAVSWTSFLTDLSSEMLIHLLPLYLSSVLGVKANIIGLIEGVAESTASLLKIASGWWSDRLQARKRLAVFGYGISALAKPFFYIATSWTAVAAVRWVERVGKGVRTAPRDALLADSFQQERRGFAFGFHRAADTAGAVLGLLVAMAVVYAVQGQAEEIGEAAFRTIVLVSVIPAVLAVWVLAIGARDVPPNTVPSDTVPSDTVSPNTVSPSTASPSTASPSTVPADVETSKPRPRLGWRGLGRRFGFFLFVVGVFDLGNSADAFLILRASERGLNVLEVLAMLLTFNGVYTLSSTPGGVLSDRFGRRQVLIAGWSLYALVYLGLGLAETGGQVWALAAVYGAYYGLTYGTAKALVADLVPGELRGTAYGTFHAVLGLIDLPASVIAGILWHGIGSFKGWGAPAPFFFGAAMAALATLLLALGGRHLAPEISRS